MSVGVWLPQFLRKALFDNDESSDSDGSVFGQIAHLVARAPLTTSQIRRAVPTGTSAVGSSSWSQALAGQTSAVYILGGVTFSNTGSEIGAGSPASVVASLRCADGTRLIMLPTPVRVAASTAISVRRGFGGTYIPSWLAILYCLEGDLSG